MRAFVYFWDGYVLGPKIETSNDELASRIARAIDPELDPLPARVAARFIAFDLAEERDTMVWSAPPGRTIGQQVTAAQAPDNWPTLLADQAGVFLVHTGTGEVQVIGGLGFAPSADETNVRALRHHALNVDGEILQ